MFPKQLETCMCITAAFLDWLLCFAELPTLSLEEASNQGKFIIINVV